MSTTFKRTKEDFTCARCGAEVQGNGYTNHCSKCLWSTHVDNFPGDRAASCGGLMEPISVESTSEKYIITHQCTLCGVTRRVTSATNDTVDTIIQIAERA